MCYSTSCLNEESDAAFEERDEVLALPFGNLLAHVVEHDNVVRPRLDVVEPGGVLDMMHPRVLDTGQRLEHRLEGGLVEFMAARDERHVEVRGGCGGGYRDC